MKGRLTRGEAIRQNCLECCGYSAKEVRLCPCKNCPLYPYRLGREDRNGNYTGENLEGEKV